MNNKDMEEIKEIIECDADNETKYKMISNILTAKLHYFEKHEPKIGRWIYWHTNGFGRKIYKCSKCNWYGDTLGYNFCPHCGADMRDKKENDTRSRIFDFELASHVLNNRTDSRK